MQSCPARHRPARDNGTWLLVRPNEAVVGRLVGRARWHGAGHRDNAHRDFRFCSSLDLEWFEPRRDFGALGSSAIGTCFATTHGTTSTASVDHHNSSNYLRPGSARRLPSAPATTSPAVIAAVAPTRSRDVSSAGGSAVALDLTCRSPHRKGHVDLGVEQHRRW